METIDLKPIIETLIPIIGMILTIIAAVLSYYVRSWLATKVDLSNTQLDEQLQQQYDYAASRAISYAESVIKGAVPKEANIENDYVATAAGYLMKFWPDLVKKLDLTPDSVKKTILARLPSGIMNEKADAIVLAKAGVVSTTPTEAK